VWEPSAIGYLNLVNNNARPGSELTADNIAISYSFTTSKDDKVLQYIAEPAAWFSDQITTFLCVSATKKLTGAALFYANSLGADNDLPAADWDLNEDGAVNALDFDRNDDDAITTADFLIGADPQEGFGYNDLLVAADADENGFPTTLPPNPSSPLNALFGAEGPCTLVATPDPLVDPSPGTAYAGSDAVDCVGVALASQFREELPAPIPGVNRNVTADGVEFTNAITIDDSTITPVGLLSAVAGNIPGSNGVLAAQGSVSLPYYLGDTGAGIAGAGAVNWKADSALATSLNETFSALGVTLPQADPSVSTAVNYIFPFPKQLSTKEVPLLALYPTTGAIKGVVMYQHGITTDRSSALTFGTGLAGQGYVVVAIDHPLHGVEPFSSAAQQGLAVQLLDAGQTGGLPPFLASDQTFWISGEDNVTLTINGDITFAFVGASLGSNGAIDLSDGVDAGEETTIENTITAGLNGATGDPDFDAGIQSLRAFENTVANAGSTIPGLAPAENERHFGLFANATGAPAAMVFDPADAKGTDGSGSFYINLENLLAARDNNRQSVVDQMNLRATLFGSPTAGKAGVTLKRPAGDIDVTAADPVYFAGHSLGTLTGMPFIASVNEDDISETIFTAADGSENLPSTFNNIQSASLLTPGGGIVRLLENSPSFAPRILFGLQQAAGLTQGSASLEAFFNVAQAALDASDPVNFAARAHATTPILLSEVTGETVIPNAADDAEWGIPALAGTFTPEQTGLPVSVTIDSFPAPLSGTRPLTLPLADGINNTLFTTYGAGSHATPTSGSPSAVFGGMLCETFVTFNIAPADLPAFCQP
jgi:hypothetical protein